MDHGKKKDWSSSHSEKSSKKAVDPPDPKKNTWSTQVYSDKSEKSAKKSISDPKNHKKHVLIGVISVLLLIIIILAKPAVSNFQLNKDLGRHGVSAEQVLEKVNLQDQTIKEQNNQIEECETQRAQEETRTIACEQTINIKNNEDKTQYTDKIQALEAKIAQTTEEFNHFKSIYDNTIGKAATNICCKARVDDPDIDSYSLVEDKISCTKGGELKIKCP